MEYYVVTRSGREAIPVLRKAGREDDAGILEFLGKADGATVGQVAEAMRMDERITYEKLRSLSIKRWVWRKMTKLASF